MTHRAGRAAGRRGGDSLQFRLRGQRGRTSVDKLERRLFHATPEQRDGPLVVELTNDFAWPEDVCVAAATVR